MTKRKKVLVVDASKVVRASLVKYLRGNFDVCEESNTESAWQSLVLDASIVAVLSGLDINKFEGADLIERIRASKLVRLNRLPFYLLASASFSEDDKSLAKKLGVSDFVPKATAETAIKDLFGKLEKPDTAEAEHAEVVMLTSSQVGPAQVACGGQSDIGLSDFMSRMRQLDDFSDVGTETLINLDIPEERRQPLPSSENDVEPGESTDEPAGVVVFGLDAYKDFIGRYGQQLADKVVMKFSRLLSGKIRGQEKIVHLADGYIGIVSPTANRDQCANFAGRVCKALAKAHISVHGQRIETTVSVGVAAVPEETGERTMNELLRLGVSRLEEAMRLGGNQAIFSSTCEAKPISRQVFLEQMTALLAKAGDDQSMTCKEWMNHLCAACRQSRQSGQASPCICDPTGGHCGRCAATGC